MNERSLLPHWRLGSLSGMPSSPVSASLFYDRLSKVYDRLYPSWDETIIVQAAALSRLIEDHSGTQGGEVLDCACGIGTQALGLAARGYDVTGIDISRKAVARARQEARRRKLWSARFEIADMRELPVRFQDAFDVVICCDNPFAHLLSAGEVRIAFLAMRTALRSGGLLLVSTQDYSELLTNRPREVAFRHSEHGRQTTIVFQIWDWDSEEPVYVNNQFVLRQRIFGWKMHQATTRMRAYMMEEIGEEAELAGFTDVRWRGLEESGFFQPILSAMSPS